MRVGDLFGFASRALSGALVRTSLMLLATAIGVAAVVILTGLGEGARRYVTGEFASLGANLLIVFPGKSETTGGAPPMMAETPRDLTVEDAAALYRNSAVSRVAPMAIGSAGVSANGLEREVPVLGSSAELLEVRHMKLSLGEFLPPAEFSRAMPVCVLGTKLRRELFGGENPLGQWVRIGDRRFRVIGVMAEQGQAMGTNTDDMVVVPVASAQALFNSYSLVRILVEARDRDAIQPALRAVKATLKERHEGEEDVTVITQDSVLATFDRIFNALTLTVGGIAAISLLVAGILIMNVMLVAVSQRTAEIGLLKALGAPGRQILSLFLTEAALLSLFGGAIGLLLGLGVSALLGTLYPALDFTPPLWAAAAGLGVALISGVLFGVLPARRAARLDPVRALSRR